MKADLGQFAGVGHGYFTFPKLEGEVGPWMTFRGKKVLNWSLNNYLGLCNHPEVRKADGDAAVKYGLGYPMGSRMLTGNTDIHEQFERVIVLHSLRVCCRSGTAADADSFAHARTYSES